MARDDTEDDFGIRPAYRQRKQAEEIAQQTAAYLAAGGKINSLDTGIPCTEQKRKTTWGYEHSVANGGKASAKVRRKNHAN